MWPFPYGSLTSSEDKASSPTAKGHLRKPALPDQSFYFTSVLCAIFLGVFFKDGKDKYCNFIIRCAWALIQKEKTTDSPRNGSITGWPWLVKVGGHLAHAGCCHVGFGCGRAASLTLTSRQAKPQTWGTSPGFTPALLWGLSLEQPRPPASQTVISTTQTATLGAATVHEFVSLFSKTPESPLSSQTARPLKNQNAAQMSTVPTLPKSLQRHEPFARDYQGNQGCAISVTKT